MTLANETVDMPQTPELRSRKLERNRTTARVRRHKKKKEAEELTAFLNALIQENEMLISNARQVLTDAGSSKEQAQRKVELNVTTHLSKPQRGCLFCNVRFSEGERIFQHYQVEHAVELTSLPSECKDVLEDNEKTLEYLEAAEEANRTCETKNKNLAKLNRNQLHFLSETEKRSRRQMKNAESARLCRQRKKLYIQKLRMKIPTQIQKNTFLKSWLVQLSPIKEEKFSEEDSIQSEENKIVLPKFCGWHINKKRNFSSNNLCELALPKRINSDTPIEEQQILSGLQNPMKPINVEQLSMMNQLLSEINLESPHSSKTSSNPDFFHAFEAAKLLTSLRNT